MALTDYDKKNLTKAQQTAISNATKAYNEAKARGDKAGMEKAHNEANSIRNSAGYTSDKNGNYAGKSSKVQNAYNITTDAGTKLANQVLSTGRATSIGNDTLYKDASGNLRVKKANGNDYAVTVNPSNPYTKIGQYKYVGDTTFDKDGITVNMNTDYDALSKQYANNPQALKLIQEARNAKLQALAKQGISFNTKNNLVTDNYSDVNFDSKNTALDNAYTQWANSINNAEASELKSLKEQLNAQQNLVDTAENQSNQSYAEQMRQAYIDSELAKKAQNELLASRGVTGGNAETQRLNTENAYKNLYSQLVGARATSAQEYAQKRAELQNTYATQYDAIKQTYGQKTADAYLDYKTQKATSEETARQKLIAQLGL